MLQRFILHLSLVMLFALTQMGVAMHEISHLNDVNQHSEQDKSAPNHQCEQCIGHADLSNGLAFNTYDFAIIRSDSIAIISETSHFAHTQLHSYSARAPPVIT